MSLRFYCYLDAKDIESQENLYDNAITHNIQPPQACKHKSITEIQI